MRVLGIDYGRRRIGLAVSDASAILATPWRSVPARGTAKDSAAVVAVLVGQSARVDEPFEAIVVGLPRKLSGEETAETAEARTFGLTLERRTGVPVHFQDERLTSKEAESRLALREKNWRKRRERLDAAAAAIILQDFLESRSAMAPPTWEPGGAE